MDCSLIQPDLVSYHFGAASDEAREAVDAHLLACTKCLRTYLRLKHHIERGSDLSERPSDDARRRLRAAVETAFRPKARDRVSGWLRRPIPLYQGLAAAAVVIAIAWVGPLVARRLADTPAATHASNVERIDTSRSNAASLTVY